MIDTHAHINTDKFDEDRNQVIDRAIESGLSNIIIPAIEPDHFDGLIELTQSRKEIKCGIGIHPHNVKDVDDKDLEKVRSYSQKEGVVAIGEIGIDYYYDFAPPSKQVEVFDKQIKIALERELPIIVHNRDSDEDVINTIKKNQNGELRGVLHCFSSSTDILKRVLDLGMMVSFTGNITFKKSTLDDVVKEAPLDRIMIETDSPYMAPVPKRGKRNEPSYVRYVAEKISEIKEISLEEVIEMTSKNAKKLFNLSLVLFSFIFLSNLAFAQDDDEYYEDDDFIEGQGLYIEGYIENSRGPIIGVEVSIGDQTVYTDSTGFYIFENLEPGIYEVIPYSDDYKFYPRVETVELDYYGVSEVNFEIGFSKFIGLGFVGGVNTIVTVNQDADEEISDEGLPAFGGEITFYPTNYLFLKGTYLLSLNNKFRDNLILNENFNGNLPDPGSHEFIEISLNATPNPNKTINFYGSIGYSFITNISYSQVEGGGIDEFQKKTGNRSAINYGIGLMANWNLGKGGLLALSAEVKFNYELGKETGEIWRGLREIEDGVFVNVFDQVEIYRIFSIPRVSLSYYPNFGI